MRCRRGQFFGGVEPFSIERPNLELNAKNICATFTQDLRLRSYGLVLACTNRFSTDYASRCFYKSRRNCSKKRAAADPVNGSSPGPSDRDPFTSHKTS